MLSLSHANTSPHTIQPPPALDSHEAALTVTRQLSDALVLIACLQYLQQQRPSSDAYCKCHVTIYCIIQCSNILLAIYTCVYIRKF